MNIIVFNGSPRRKHSYNVIQSIQSIIASKGHQVDFEYLDLYDADVKSCIGCMQCFEKGEGVCPVKDDTYSIYKRLIRADGFIFASPVYAMHVTGQMKRVVDRLSFLFHRPALIDKPAITLVTTEGGGIKPTQAYLKMIALGWGCRMSGELSVMSSRYFESSQHYSDKYRMRTDRKLQKLVKQFWHDLSDENPSVPTFKQLYYFYGLKSKTYIYKADSEYWEKKGWLDAKYYYPISLNPLKWLFATSMDLMIKVLVKMMLKEVSV